MGLTKGVPPQGGSGGGRGHSGMEHWMKTADIKDAARVVRRRNTREEINGGPSDYLSADGQKTDGSDEDL